MGHGCIQAQISLLLPLFFPVRPFPVVTLPAKYLGSRWSAAFYSIMGIDELTATSEDDYVRIALRLGIDQNWRQRVRGRILATVGRLFERDEAVDAWAALLTRLARGGDPRSDGSIEGAGTRAPTREEATGQTIKFGAPPLD